MIPNAVTVSSLSKLVVLGQFHLSVRDDPRPVSDRYAKDNRTAAYVAE